MTEMLLWKGKGVNAVLDPGGSLVAFEKSGVVIANVASKVEVYRDPKGQDPQWIRSGELAYRTEGGAEFVIYHAEDERVEVGDVAPGAQFRAAYGHWASWEKKAGRLHVDGVVVREGVGEIVAVTDTSVVVWETPPQAGGEVRYLVFAYGDPVPTRVMMPLPGDARPLEQTTTTSEGIMVTVKQHEKKIEVWVEVPDGQ